MSYEADIMSFVGERVSREAAAMVVRRADAEIEALKKKAYEMNDNRFDLATQILDLRSALAASQTRVRELEAAIGMWNRGFEEARDCVLNERHQLAEQGASNDVINAVLAIMDEAFDPALSPTIGQDTLARMEAAEAVCEKFLADPTKGNRADIEVMKALSDWQEARVKGAKNG